MKNLYNRLTKAPADASVTYSHGIYQNYSPCADTPTGYAVSKNQNSKKWRLVPMLLALLMLQFTLGIYKLNAQTVWTSRTSAADNAWTSVTYGNSTYVAVASNATGNGVMTSPDGITWTIRTSAADNQWTSVTYGNGLFVAVSRDGFGNRVMTSPDGITWTSRTSAADNQWNSVTYGNNLFVAVSNTGTGNRVMTSPDGVTWTIRTSAADNLWTSVTYGNNLFVAVSSSGSSKVMTSPDGITWTSRTLTFGSFSTWAAVTYGNGLFVAVANTGTTKVMTSPDGITWTGRSAASTNTCQSVTYGNGSFVAVSRTGTGDRVMTSPDGVTWTSRTSATDNQWFSVIHGNDLFVAVSFDGTGNGVMTSPSTITFNQTLPSCASAADGGLRAIPPTICATGYQYLWTPGGATTDTISNLAPGTYSVRVICGTDTVNKSVTLTASTVIAAPTTAGSIVVFTGTKNISQLDVTPLAGGSLNYYYEATGGTALPGSTVVVDDTTYYISQTVAGCESNPRKQIKVNRISNDSIVLCNSDLVASLTATPLTGNTVKWFEAPTGGSALANNAVLATGVDTLYVEEGNSNNKNVQNIYIPSPTSLFITPIEYDSNDTLYFGETNTTTNSTSVYKIKTDGTEKTLVKDFGTDGPGSLLIIDSLGTKFLYAGQFKKITKINLNTGAVTTITASADLLGVSDMTYDPANKLIYGSAGYINQGTLPNGTVIFKYNTNTGEFTSLDTLQATTGLGFATSSVPGSNGALFIGSGLGAVFKLELTPTPSLTLAGSIAPVRDVDVLPNGNLLIQSGQNLLLTNQTGTVLDTCYKFISNTTFTGYVSVKSNDELFFSGALNPASIYKLNVIEPGVSNRVPVTIIVNPSPLVDSIANMQVCPSSTVPAINFTTPIIGGTVGYKWSNSNTAVGLAASGFGNIPSFTAAATAQTSTISVTPYMLKSATDTCFGTVRTFNIAADLPAAPTTTGNLVVYTGTKTVSQLAVTPLAGGTLNYYYQATGGTALAGSTIVVDDTTYYVTQTVAGCESNPRKPIKVNRIAADSIVLCSPATVAGLTATPQAGNTAIWYDVPSSGTALANTTALALGQDTLYVEEGNSSAQLSLHSYSTNNPSSTINAFTIGQNDTIYYGVFQDSAKIFRINPDGTGATIISSGGPNESIRFMQYESDASGRYILYSTENTVKRRNLNTGVVTTIWTSPNSPAFNLRQVSRDEANNKLYVADTEFGRIKLVDLANNTAVTIDSLPYKQFGASSFPRRPFAVCYVAPNSLYIGDLTNSLVFKKNLTTGVKTDSISFNSPKEISLLPNGKLMIVGGDRIITTNQDLTGSTNLVTSISSANSAKYNSIGELVYTDYRTIKKISSIQSNRVPVTVIVNPKPIVTATIDKVVCNNSTVSAVNFSTTTIGGTVTYAWTNNKPAIGLAASGTGNIVSFSGVNNGTAPDTATIIVTPTITNAGLSCVGVKDTFLIIVNPTANVNTINNQVVCNGSAVTTINFGTTNTGGTVTYAWTNNTTSIGLAASGTGNIATFNGVNTGTAPVTATIVVTPTFTNGGVSCAGPTKTFTITVNPTVTVNPENDQVVCNGGGSTTINFSTTATGGTTTYTWTNNKPTNGLAASGIGNIASFTAVNNGTAPDTATIIITPTFANGGTNCVGTKDTIYVVVNPTAKINAIADKAACNGSVVVATMPTSTATGGTVTYTWTNNTTSIGLAASGTGNIPSFTATNTGSTAITSTIIVTPTFTNGGVSCVGTNDTFNITVNPPPIFAATADKYVCNASTTTPVVFSTALTGGTAVYHWTNSNTAIGLAATGTGNVPSFTATNNTTAPIMGSIVVYMDYTNAGLTCTSLKDTFSYVVNPTAVVNPVNDQVLCNGAAVTALNFSTTANGGITTYAWTNDKPGIGLAATGTGNIAAFTAVNNSATPDTATIIVTPTFANGGTSCQGIKDTIYIVVDPSANVNTINNQTVCNGAAVSAINFGTTNTGGTVTYAWTNNTTSIGLAASGTGNIATFNGVNNGTSPVTATITVTPTFTNGGVSCAGPTKTFTITVNPTVTVNPENDQVVCNGAGSTAINFSTTATGGTTTYTWTNNKPTNGLAASGTGNIASFTAVNNGTAPDTATIIVTPTFANGGTNCVGTKDTIYVVVNPTAKINAIADKVECNGSVVVATMPTSTATGGTVTYTWTNNTTSIGLGASGTGAIPSFTATNTGSTAITSTIIVTPTYTNGGVSCVGTNDTFNITINPPPIFAATTDKYVCNASTTTAVVFTTALTGGTAVYHWTNNNTAIGLAASGTGNVPSFTATNTTTAPIMGSIVVYMDYTNAGLTCTSLRDTFNYVVNPTAVVNPINDQVLCNGSTTAAISFSTTATGGILTYNWTNNNTSFGLAASGTGNIASFNAINNTNAPQIATITVTPVFSNGGVSCTGTATSFTITVNPEMIVNAISSQVLCNNASTTAVNFASPTTGGTIVYNWTNSNTAIGLAASGSGNIASFTATNSSNAPISGTITVIATYTNAGISCTSAPQTFAYTVNPTATVNAINNQAVCNGAAVSAVNFATTATGGTVTYAWTNSNSSIGIAASGTGNIASFTATNNSNVPVTATITVTPTFTNGGVSCTGTAQSFTVTVNPTAVVNAVSSQTVCAGSSNSAVTFSSPVAGTTYSWTNSNPSIGLAASGTGNIPSFVAVNPSPNAINATITVTPNTAAGCIGQSITYAITVNGLSVAPTAIINPTPIVCANNAFATLNVSGGTLGTGAVWKWYADSLNTVSIGSGATLANIPVAKTTTYFVRAEGTCNNTAAATVVVQRANLVHHVRQHWSDVLLFDNSSRNYVAWQWYKNGVAVPGATLQQYSESSVLVGTYHVVATDRNGAQFISCPQTITATTFTGLRISLFPNPADKGANVKVATNFTTAELQGASLTISDVFGRVVSQLTQVSPLTNILAPTATGMYVVTLTLQNGVKYSSNLLTK